MLSESRKRSIDIILRGKSTNTFGDSLIHAELLSVYRKDPEAFNYVREKILEMRKDWLKWHINNQYHWQACGKNRHHDSFELRESYVACHANNDSEFLKRAREYNKKRKPELFKKFKY